MCDSRRNQRDHVLPQFLDIQACFGQHKLGTRPGFRDQNRRLPVKRRLQNIRRGSEIELRFVVLLLIITLALSRMNPAGTV